MKAAVPYPPLELAERVGSLAAAGDPWWYYDRLGEGAREEILAALGPDWSFEGKRVLDFGCGAGRTLRRFLREAEAGELWGCDIDKTSIDWLEKHLSPPLRVFVNDENPPLPHPDGSFDLIWAASVFTHLTDSWSSWLLELHRLLADGGLLYATFISQASSGVVTDERWDEGRIGMNVLRYGQSWDKGGPMVLHSPWWIEAHWGRAFEIVRLAESGFTDDPQVAHGAVLMRKRDISLTPADLEAPEADEPRETESLAHSRRQLLNEVAELREQLERYAPPEEAMIASTSPERFSPGDMKGALVESEHRGRYWWAAQLTAGRDVLDAGCGTAYGTSILAAAGARRVVGIDIDESAFADAEPANGRPIELRAADLRALPFADDTFDVAVCFEVIEHIDGRDETLAELRRVLRPGGVLVISSPNRGIYPPGNPHHVHEYQPQELREALERYFRSVKLYRQQPWLSSAVLDDDQLQAIGPDERLELSVVKIAGVEPGRETFTLALAGDAELPSPEAVVTMGDSFEVRWWQDHLAAARAATKRIEREAELRESHRDETIAEIGRRLLEAEADLAREGTAAELRRQLLALGDDYWSEHQRAVDFETRLRQAERTIDDLNTSLSWRLTAPLRLFKRPFRR